eukprot:PhF_6_TR6162/c4_g1_i2/m.9183
MRNKAPAAGPALYDQLELLEDGLRRDAIRRKGDTTLVIGATRRNFKDAAEHDSYRVRNILKLFILSSLVGKAGAVAQTPREWMLFDLDSIERVYHNVLKDTAVAAAIAELKAERDQELAQGSHTSLRSAVSGNLMIPEEGAMIASANHIVPFGDVRRSDPGALFHRP